MLFNGFCLSIYDWFICGYLCMLFFNSAVNRFESLKAHYKFPIIITVTTLPTTLHCAATINLARKRKKGKRKRKKGEKKKRNATKGETRHTDLHIVDDKRSVIHQCVLGVSGIDATAVVVPGDGGCGVATGDARQHCAVAHRHHHGLRRWLNHWGNCSSHMMASMSGVWNNCVH